MTNRDCSCRRDSIFKDSKDETECGMFKVVEDIFCFWCFIKRCYLVIKYVCV